MIKPLFRDARAGRLASRRAADARREAPARNATPAGAKPRAGTMPSYRRRAKPQLGDGLRDNFDAPASRMRVGGAQVTMFGGHAGHGAAGREPHGGATSRAHRGQRRRRRWCFPDDAGRRLRQFVLAWQDRFYFLISLGYRALSQKGSSAAVWGRIYCAMPKIARAAHKRSSHSSRVGTARHTMRSAKQRATLRHEYRPHQYHAHNARQVRSKYEFYLLNGRRARRCRSSAITYHHTSWPRHRACRNDEACSRRQDTGDGRRENYDDGDKKMRPGDAMHMMAMIARQAAMS